MVGIGARLGAVVGALAMLIGAVGVSPALAVAPSPSGVSAPVLAAAPGVPEPATVIYQEDFQNAPVAGATRIADYVSTTGATYTAAPVYLNSSLCNGVIFGRQAS